MLLAVGLLAVLVVVGACGGDDDDRTIDLGDDGEITIDGDLPDDFPDDFPIYDGADFQGAFTGEQEGIAGIVATWTTGDSADDVTAFYESEFEEGPWTSTSSGTGGGSSYWTVENDDGSLAGYVGVSGDGEGVSIIATIGDNTSVVGDGDTDTDSDSDSDSGSADLPDEVSLQDDFPSDIPLADDAHVVNAGTLTIGDSESFIVAYYSEETIEDLGALYEDGLTGYNQTFETSTGDGLTASYAQRTDGTGNSVTVAVTESDVPGYNQVTLQVTVAD